MDRNIFPLLGAWSAVLLTLGILLPWNLDLRRVEGRSMEPVFHPGQTVLSWRWAYGLPKFWEKGYFWLWSLPGPGDVVVVSAPPGDHFAIKRVARIIPGTVPPEVFVLGDNSSVSRDSRDFGPLPVEDVLGKVVF